MSKPAIALYLGESYATIGLFDTTHKKQVAALFEKSIFLPQVSLKNLLNQTKLKIQELFDYQFESPEHEIPIYIVTKYFDRLKQFRLGGSISQVVLKGFENSYTLRDSKALSLAASQLIIPLEGSEIEATHLEHELSRIKKINPDLNKVVISIPEGDVSASQIELLNNFFITNGLKIFNCPLAHNQSYLRKTLLNAGSEGTKEELVSDLKEAFGERVQINFFSTDGFRSDYENCELFTSATNFLAHYIKSKQHNHGTYFDIECLKFVVSNKKNEWQSPWGAIPIEHYYHIDLHIHPYSEVKLNHLSILQIESNVQQLEPGPVVAGRAIKPLVLDLFYNELLNNDLAKSLFSQLQQENLNLKIKNLFTVLEKGQKNPSLATRITDFKKNIQSALANEVLSHSAGDPTLVFGPLADIFMMDQGKNNFSWTKEIMAAALREH
ncbi:MAG: hypothetical protein AABY53_04865 [Bdellovibrionota bacterium]